MNKNDDPRAVLRDIIARYPKADRDKVLRIFTATVIESRELERTAQTIAALRAAEQESRDPVPSTYWYSDPIAVSAGIERQPEWEGIVPLPRPPPTARPALRRAEQSENRGAFRRKLRSDYP
jgi:hypothetical protein